MDINLDLFVVGVTAVAIGILGFVVFINNKKSITHKIFLVESIVTVIYIFVNYFAYKFLSPDVVLLLLRSVLFVALWHAFFMFYLFYVFPDEKMPMPWWLKKILLPAMFAVSAVVLSSFAFVSIDKKIVPGEIALATQGPGLAFFGIMVVGLVIGGLFLFLRKMMMAQGEQKISGTFLMLSMCKKHPLASGARGC